MFGPKNAFGRLDAPMIAVADYRLNGIKALDRGPIARGHLGHRICRHGRIDMPIIGFIDTAQETVEISQRM